MSMNTLAARVALASAVAVAALFLMAGSLLATPAPAGSDPSYRYAINLASFREPVEPASLPRLHVFNEYLAYATEVRVDGEDWHRLRLGFFPSGEAASEVMRSVREEFPDAWVTRVSAVERARSRDYAVFPGAAALEGPEEEAPRPPATPKPPRVDTPASLMAEAGRAMADGDYNRAVNLYTEVLRRPGSGFQKEALELLGLAYERNGNKAQARAEYQTYLLLYPSTPRATGPSGWGAVSRG